MKKLVMHSAVSLDGKIARPDGSVDWLHQVPNPEKSDYGYSEFYDTIDTTLMGRKTYEDILTIDVDFPYPDKTNYVFTRNKDWPKKQASHVNFVAEHIEGFVEGLKKEEGKDIWLVGGGEINALLLRAGLLDEILLFVMPVVLGEGIGLFHNTAYDKHLEVVETKSYAGGVLMLHYKC